MLTYHRSNRLAAMRDFDTAAAVGRAVPGLAAEGRAVEAGGEFVGRERAGSALDVAAVEGRFAGHGAAGEGGWVGALVVVGVGGGGQGCCGGCGCREEGDGTGEVHGWGCGLVGQACW